MTLFPFKNQYYLHVVEVKIGCLRIKNMNDVWNSLLPTCYWNWNGYFLPYRIPVPVGSVVTTVVPHSGLRNSKIHYTHSGPSHMTILGACDIREGVRSSTIVSDIDCANVRHQITTLMHHVSFYKMHSVCIFTHACIHARSHTAFIHGMAQVI